MEKKRTLSPSNSIAIAHHPTHIRQVREVDFSSREIAGRGGEIEMNGCQPRKGEDKDKGKTKKRKVTHGGVCSVHVTGRREYKSLENRGLNAGDIYVQGPKIEGLRSVGGRI